jgi:hypothetical protein
LATRDGLETPAMGSAVQLAERACQATRYMEPAVLDTLAAALADAGRFDLAITRAKEALKLASDQANAELAEEISQRLALYEARQAYREPD